MEQVNSIELVFFDPKYKDERVVLLDIKSIVSLAKNASWSNASHPVTYSCLWREREDRQGTPFQMKMKRCRLALKSCCKIGKTKITRR